MHIADKKFTVGKRETGQTDTLKTRLPFEHVAPHYMKLFLLRELGAYEMSAIKFHVLNCSKCKKEAQKAAASLLCELSSDEFPADCSDPGINSAELDGFVHDFEPDSSARVRFPAPAQHTSVGRLDSDISSSCSDKSVQTTDPSPRTEMSVTACELKPDSRDLGWASLRARFNGDDRPGQIVKRLRLFALTELNLGRIKFRLDEKENRYDCDLTVEGDYRMVHWIGEDFQKGTVVKVNPDAVSPYEHVRVERPHVFAISALFDNAPGIVVAFLEKALMERQYSLEPLLQQSILAFPNGSVLSMDGQIEEQSFPDCSVGVFRLEMLLGAPSEEIAKQILDDVKEFLDKNALRWVVGDMGQTDLPLTFCKLTKEWRQLQIADASIKSRKPEKWNEDCNKDKREPRTASSESPEEAQYVNELLAKPKYLRDVFSGITKRQENTTVN